MSKPTIVPRSLRNPSAAAPINRFGWDGDLVTIPALTFEPALSTGCTEAQALAMFSVSSGGLVVDPALAVAAGADANFEAVLWSTPGIQAPLEFNWRSQQLTLALAGSIVAGGWFHFADQAALETVTPTPPTGASPGTAAHVYAGHGGHNPTTPSSAYGWRSGYTTPPTRIGGFTNNAYCVAAGVETYASAPSAAGVATSFSSYPTSLSMTSTRTTSTTNDLSAAHRLRGFIGVFRNGAGTANNGNVRINTATWVAQAEVS